MALFQNSVIKKHLQALNQESIQEKWQKFQAHFFNATIQDNIRNSKEEQYQGEFLIDLFVNILGYTKNPTPNFNLTTEYKNVKDSKKADGAILIDDKVRAVIELKGTNTTDLGKIEAQAFGYKNNQPECVYVITSNFEKLRFYIDNAIEHIEFNLFQLSKTEFELLYLCLAYDNIKNNVAKSIKDQSVSEEDVITKKLYKDYSLFKRELFQNLVQLNPQHDPLVLFQKTQKLLDRFLFIFFAEDRNLLPTNLIFRINKEWQQLQQMRIQVSLYDRYKTYFDDLNTGAKVQLPAFSQTNSIAKEEHQIFAYNGGLFKADDILDNIKIDDAVLFQHTEKLSNYDFASEVDVNILGHIFENSLNELDEIKAQLEGDEIDKTKTKRKKDGVFYTPKYITKYIVENTVGKLCNEKKADLGITDEDYIADKKRQKKTIQILVEKLDHYRKWLLQLTICDPACGSGAFLNQALDFLIAEHHYIDELQAKLFGDAMVLSDIATSILEHNLFGVDLNEESVEIAKLSLWLRTAQPNRKLNDLNSNIKCGNSLIDDPAIAGDKAFNWQQAFPKVFEKGGFDVIIGNPPYGAKLELEVQNYLNKKYIKGGSETVISFTKLSYDTLLKKDGQFGFIIPKSFSFSSNYESIRAYILNDINEIIDCKKVWKEVLLEQIIFFFQKGKKTENFKSGILKGQQIHELGLISKNTFDEFGFYLNGISEEELKIAQKVNSSKKYIKDIASNSRGGIFQNRIGKEGDTMVLGGAEIQREGIIGIKGYVNKSTIQEDKKCFIKNNSLLVQRLIAHIENPTEHIKITACLPLNNNYAIVDTINQITFQKEYNANVFWCLFNSKLINWYSYRFILAKAIRTMQFDNPITNRIPIPDKINQQPFIEKADQMLSLNKELQEAISKFQRTIQRKFNLEDLPKKLQDWYLLTYAEFIKELAKKKVKLSLSEEAEWEEYFNQESKKAQELKAQIDATDKAIDAMVYALYGLSEEEIGIVEKS
jgi:type I restriction-modification system DNA methylase subunit